MEKEEVCWAVMVVVGEGRREDCVRVGKRERLVRERVSCPRGEVCGRTAGSGLWVSRDIIGVVERDVEAKARVLCWCRRVERRLIRALKLGVRDGIESKMHFTTRPQRRHMLGEKVE